MRVRLRVAAALLAGNLFALLPSSVWTYSVTGQVAPLGNLGVAAAIDGLTFGVNNSGDRLPIDLPADVEAVMRTFRLHAEEIRTPSDLNSFGLTVLRRDPLAIVKFGFIKAARSWYGTDSRYYEGYAAIIQAFYLSAILACSLRAIRHGGLMLQFALVAWVLAGYFWLMTCLALPILRYMAPAMGMLFIIVAVGAPNAVAHPEGSRTAAA
jgi:hypothetical protein